MGSDGRLWMKKRAVARYLGVSERTIDNWRHDRGFPAHKIGRVVRLDRHEVSGLRLVPEPADHVPVWMTKQQITDHIEALTDQRDEFRDALVEITSPPDASKGEYYGCLDLHEARMTARDALGEM